jgi:CspA family cold shock protein
MENGKIARWFDKGFGFIEPASGGDNVFVHINDVADEYAFDDLPVGCTVTYEIGPGRKPGTTEAKNVRVVGGNK